MQTAPSTVEPYRAYTPRPFTRSERDQTTLLFGGLHWRAEQVIQATFENLGYKARRCLRRRRRTFCSGAKSPTSGSVARPASRPEISRTSCETKR